MANDSIYNIPEHNSARSYVKNAIVFVQEIIEGTNGVPKSIKYYYALQDVPSSTAVTNVNYWGGFTRTLGAVGIGTTSNGSQLLPEFLWIPSYNVSVNNQPSVNPIVFGNGYEQRIQNGIYNTLIKIDLSFDMRTDIEARAILHFLKARKGTESFVMRHLPSIYADGGYKKRFYCANFTSSFVFHDNHSIKATFIETNT
jgi:phage-related protein